MNQFNSDYFIFDGVDSEAMGIMMCTIGDGTENLMMGLSRTPNLSDSIGDIKILKNITNEYHTFSITLTKVHTLANGKKILGKFTQQELFYIQKWLFKNEYKPFVPKYEDKFLIYYVLFTGETAYFNNANQGYLTLTMNVCPYAYRNITMKTITVEQGRTEYSLLNNTNINGKTPVDVEIKMTEGKGITITNITNNTSFSIDNMKKNQSFVIHGQQQYIENTSKNKSNLYALSNKSFIELDSGRNDFIIELLKDKAEITFKYQSKVAIY